MTQSQIAQMMKRTKDATQVADNLLYTTMSNVLKEMFATTTVITVEEAPIYTSVQQPNGKWKCEFHNATTVSMADNGHFRIAPTTNNNVDITRIISDVKGVGTIMMNIIFHAFIVAQTEVKQYPTATLVLECTGSIGVGENYRKMPIKDQSAFFRKFGFRKFGKYDANHIHFKLENNADTAKTFEKMTQAYASCLVD